MPATWITYNGKKILHSDYRGFKTIDKKNELLETAKQSIKMIQESREKVLILSDIRDCTFNSDFMDIVKAEFPTEKVEKHALLGVEGMKKLLIDSLQKATGHIPDIFEDETEAKNFLVR